MPLAHRHAETERLANAIEAELKRLARWSADPLPAEAYEWPSNNGFNYAVATRPPHNRFRRPRSGKPTANL